VVAAIGDVRIEHGDQIRVSHRPNLRCDRIAEILQGGDDPLALCRFAAPRGSDEQSGFTVGPANRAEEHRQVVGRRRRHFGVTPQHQLSLRPRKHDHPGQQRAHRMQANAHRRDDPEIAAAAAQGPEQFGIMRRIGGHELAVGEHNFSGQ
jgi:hypothetical protein